MQALKKKKTWPLLFLSFACLTALIYVLLVFPPGTSLTIFSFSISYIPIFFVLLFVSIYGITAFFLTSALQGVLVGGLVVGFLLFHFFNLTHPFFAVILVVLFACIEGVVWKRK
jgi:hypothetical protein